MVGSIGKQGRGCLSIFIGENNVLMQSCRQALRPRPLRDMRRGVVVFVASGYLIHMKALFCEDPSFLRLLFCEKLDKMRLSYCENLAFMRSRFCDGG